MNTTAGNPDWRAGTREAVHAADPLVGTPHHLTTAHLVQFELDVAAKHRKLFARYSSGTATPVPVHPKP